MEKRADADHGISSHGAGRIPLRAPSGEHELLDGLRDAILIVRRRVIR